MFHLELFRIRAFAAGNVAGLLASIGRGGLQFMLIIWLQGIWLPLHGYSFERHAAVGRHLHAAADRRLPGRRARRRAGCPTASAPGRSPPAACCSWPLTLRRAAAAARRLRATRSFAAAALPERHRRAACSPRRTRPAIMNSVPADQRGAASGMRATFQNAGMVLSIGVFFSLMVVGLAATLPHTMTQRPARRTACRPRAAHAVAHAAAGRQPVRRVPRLQPDRRSCSARTCSAQLPAGQRRRRSPASEFFPHARTNNPATVEKC